MAGRNTTSETAATAEAPAKRTRKSGPRRTADTHVFVKVLDEQGQHLPNARLEIAHTTKDAKSALEFMDGPNGREFKRFIVKGKQIGDEAKDESGDVTQE